VRAEVRQIADGMHSREHSPLDPSRELVVGEHIREQGLAGLARHFGCVDPKEQFLKYHA
jgi:hypothetical protein